MENCGFSLFVCLMSVVHLELSISGVATRQSRNVCECRHPKYARVSTSEMCVRVDIQNVRWCRRPKCARVLTLEICAGFDSRNMRQRRQPKHVWTSTSQYVRSSTAKICATVDDSQHTHELRHVRTQCNEAFSKPTSKSVRGPSRLSPGKKFHTREYRGIFVQRR